jgi:hypothetical protein
MLPTSPSNNEGFAGYLVGIMHFDGTLGTGISLSNCGDDDSMNYYTRVAKHVDWIASVMGVDSSELLATPKNSESDDDDDDDNESDSRSEDGEFRIPNFAASFPMKSFDDMLFSITLCRLY